MFKALFRGFTFALLPLGRRLIFLSFTLSVLTVLILWAISGYIFINKSIFEISWLETISDALGGLIIFLITWILFPGLFSATMSIFLNTIANNIEKQYYPHLSAAKDSPYFDVASTFLKFLLVLIFLNLFLCFIFIFFAPLFPFVFLTINGYLISREYFETIALRRLGKEEVRKLQKLNRGKLIFIGTLITGLLMVPIINLLVPIVATSVMVHIVENWNQKYSLIGSNET